MIGGQTVIRGQITDNIYSQKQEKIKFTNIITKSKSATIALRYLNEFLLLYQTPYCP